MVVLWGLLETINRNKSRNVGDVLKALWTTALFFLTLGENEYHDVGNTID